MPMLLLSLLASTALAQPAVTRGDALRHREFRVYASMDLYVDAASGDDAFPCTVTLPCATFTRAMNSVPYFIPHGYEVTIHVAAGTYPEGVALLGRRVDGELTVEGEAVECPASVGILPASWSPTAVSTASGVKWDLVRTGVAMSADLLRGCHVMVLSGTGSGQSNIVRTNAADGELEMSQPFTTTLDTSSVVALVAPGSIFSGSVAEQKIGIGAKLTGGGVASFSNVKATNGSSEVVIASQPQVLFTDVDFPVTLAPIALPSNLVFSNVYVLNGIDVTSTLTFTFSGLVYCSSCDVGANFIGSPSTVVRMTGSVDGTFSQSAIAAVATTMISNILIKCLPDGASVNNWAISSGTVIGGSGSTGCADGYNVLGTAYVTLDGTDTGTMSEAGRFRHGAYVAFDGNPFTADLPLLVDDTESQTEIVQDAGFVHSARGTTFSFR